MIPGISIRLRLTLWYFAVLLFGLAIFGGGVWWALDRQLIAGVDARLGQRVEGLRTVLELETPITKPEELPLELSEFAREVPEGGLMQLRDASGRTLLPLGSQPPFPMKPGSAPPLFSTLVREGVRYRVLSKSFEVGAKRYDVLVAASLAETEAVMRDVRRLLILAIPAVLILASLGGYLVSRRALAPVDEITRVAGSISVRNLSQRLSVPRTGDELQRMSETWNAVLERLDSAIHRIRRFTADASHELRTPIALIRATAELALRRQRPAEDYRAALDEIRSEAERMTVLTESLLTLARLDSDELRLTIQPVDLNAIVTDVISSSHSLAEEKRILLGAGLTPEPALAAADPVAIRSLLMALVDNAIKYTPAGGAVTIATAIVDGGVLLSVRDTGQGIEPEVLPHIFERFFRADAARSAGNGAGLGLPIAQAIAEAHGSGIVVASTPGAGSRFELTLRTASL